MRGRASRGIIRRVLEGKRQEAGRSDVRNSVAGSGRAFALALIGVAALIASPATAIASDPGAPGLSGAPPAFTNSTEASISYSADPSDATPYSFLCAYDGDFSNWSPCPPSPVALSSLDDGPHSLSVQALDMYGWQIGNVATASWTVDTSAPSPPIVTSPVDGSSITSTSVPFIASGERGATFKCSLNGGSWDVCPQATGPTPGDTSRYSVGWGTALHWGEASDWTAMQWGQTNPDGSVQWNGARYRSDFTTAFGDDNVTLSRIVGLFLPSLSCSFVEGLKSSSSLYIVAGTPDKSQWNSYDLDCANTSLAEVPGPTPGEFTGLQPVSLNTLSVIQVDRAGNESTAAGVSWNTFVSGGGGGSGGGSDTTAPDAPQLSGAPGSLTNLTSASIGISGESDASFECAIDSDTFSACASPWTASDLSIGDHTLKVRQVDVAGNTSTAAQASWTVAELAVASNPALSVDGSAPLGVGTEISGSGHGFSGSPGTASEVTKWQRCSSSIANWCSTIPGATSSTYTPTAADVGKRLRLAVTLTTTEGLTITARSATSGIVVPTAAGASSITLPVGASAPIVSQALAAVGPTWSGGLPPGLGLQYRWQRCPASATDSDASRCASILGATAASYTPTGADVGRKLRLLVGVSPSGVNVWAASSLSSPVVVRPVNTAVPTITLATGLAAPKRLSRLTASQGTWTGLHGGAFRWSWQACTGTSAGSCSDIPGKRSSALIPGTAQFGKRLRAAVTYRSPDGQLTTAYTAISQPVG